MDMKSRTSKSSAAFLVESFGDLLDDYNFVDWLAKQLKLKPCRLNEIIKSAYKEVTPLNSVSKSSLQSIYNFWLKGENSIISNDCRNGRDVVRILRTTDVSKYRNFFDSNIEVEDIILKKANRVKQYIKAPRMVYTKSSKPFHLKYLEEHPNIDCSQSTFIKYRPFYIEVST